jgi:Fe-S oxidoreductase
MLKGQRRPLKTEAGIIATACPFCMTMMSDGVKHFERENDIRVLDIVELVEKGTRIKQNDIGRNSATIQRL